MSTSDIKTRVKAAYDSGSSVRDIAAAEGVSYSTARRLVHESGAKVRTRGGDQRSERARASKAGAA